MTYFNKQNIKPALIIISVIALIIGGSIIFGWYAENSTQRFYYRFYISTPEGTEYYRAYRTFNDTEFSGFIDQNVVVKMKKLPSYFRDETVLTTSVIFEGLGDHYWGIDIDVEFYRSNPYDGGYELVKTINLEKGLLCPVEWQNKSILDVIRITNQEDDV